MKKIVSLCLVVACGVGLSLVTFKAKKESKTFAIFIPVTHPSIIDIQHGIEEELHAKDPNCNITIFNAQGNKSLLYAEAHAATKAEVDLVFTIGTGVTKSVQEVFRKTKCATPFIFTAVSDLDGLGLLDENGQQNGNFTGVREVHAFTKQVEILKAIGSPLEEVLIVYDPTNWGMERDKEEMKQKMEDAQFLVRELEVVEPSDIYKKLPFALKGAKYVMVLKDNTVVSALSSILNITEKAGVSVIASDLNSVDKGAEFAVGVLERDFGRLAGKQGIEIVYHKKSAKEVGIIDNNQFQYKGSQKYQTLAEAILNGQAREEKRDVS